MKFEILAIAAAAVPSALGAVVQQRDGTCRFRVGFARGQVSITSPDYPVMLDESLTADTTRTLLLVVITLSHVLPKSLTPMAARINSAMSADMS